VGREGWSRLEQGDERRIAASGLVIGSAHKLAFLRLKPCAAREHGGWIFPGEARRDSRIATAVSRRGRGRRAPRSREAGLSRVSRQPTPNEHMDVRAARPSN
jgi:hypothetical protein